MIDIAQLVLFAFATGADGGRGVVPTAAHVHEYSPETMVKYQCD